MIFITFYLKQKYTYLGIGRAGTETDFERRPEQNKKRTYIHGGEASRKVSLIGEPWRPGDPRRRHHGSAQSSGLKRFFPAQEIQKRQKRHAENGEMIAVDAGEQLNTRSLDAISSDRLQD